MPKLRQAGSESERQTMQNAVTAADQQIDALVYELYGLTKSELGSGLRAAENLRLRSI